jgi:hypothetical protein
MELVLMRCYFKEGVNGTLFLNGEAICDTIELPWKDNLRRVSCIPEGVYEVRKRFSLKFKNHLQIVNVRLRSEILIHPANDALKELNGCIAPVSYQTGIGKGVYSRKAFNRLLALVNEAFGKQEVVQIRIIKKSEL